MLCHQKEFSEFLVMETATSHAYSVITKYWKNYFNRNFENIKTEKLQTYILDSLIFSVWTASISFDSDSNLDTKNKKCFSDLNCITVRNHSAERENESTEMEYYQMWSILQTRTMLNFLSFDLRTFSWVLNTFAQSWL